MKEIFIKELKSEVAVNSNVTLLGWVKSKRHHGGVVFLDVVDSTGSIQVVVDNSKVSKEAFNLSMDISVESAVEVKGVLVESVNDNSTREIISTEFKIIGDVKKSYSPNPRSNFDIFDSKYVDYLFKNRHLFLRNEKVMTLLKIRHIIMGAIHNWFRSNGFTEITAPVLTAIPLYDDGTALQVDINDEKVFMTQCVAFYLESAVHSFEKVYNLGPSFRGEESKSKRHLMEYWHVKAEIAFCDLEGIISTVEKLISDIVTYLEAEHSDIMAPFGTRLCTAGKLVPFPRITYREAVQRLNDAGIPFEFGKSLGSSEEEFLSKQFDTPFWITGNHRNCEPFPYRIDKDDPEVTRTADLIATEGYGELLGVAEKITDPEELSIRMEEKGKLNDPRYDWFYELREYGCVPHCGIGMGLERLIRWIVRIPHVRDVMPFPRSFNRRIYP